MKKFSGEIKNGNAPFLNDAIIYALDQEGIVEVTIKKVKNKRTLRQNSALHKYFELLAIALNEAGWDMRRTLKQDVYIPWTPENVKEHLWRPIQKAQLNKESTTDLDTKEIDIVFETLNRHLAEVTGVHEPFPSIQELMNQARGWK